MDASGNEGNNYKGRLYLSIVSDLPEDRKNLTEEAKNALRSLALTIH